MPRAIKAWIDWIETGKKGIWIQMGECVFVWWEVCYLEIVSILNFKFWRDKINFRKMRWILYFNFTQYLIMTFIPSLIYLFEIMLLKD